MAQCKRCKDDLAPFSKVCERCGYIDQEVDLSVEDQYANILEEYLLRLRSIPRPTFGKSVAEFSYIMLPIISLIALVLAIISEAGMFWILFAILLGFTIVSVVKKIRGTLGNTPLNNEFKLAKENLESYRRIANRNFGKSRVVRELLDDITTQVERLSQLRRKLSLRNTAIWAFLMVVTIALSAWQINGLHERFSGVKIPIDVEDIEIQDRITALLDNDELQRAITEYDNLVATHLYDSQADRQKILNTIMLKENLDQAIRFFSDKCKGQMGDYACAETIVKQLIRDDQFQKAEQFVESCSRGLRYAADYKKLKALLK